MHGAVTTARLRRSLNGAAQLHSWHRWPALARPRRLLLPTQLLAQLLAPRDCGLRGPLRAYHVDVAQDLHGLHLRHIFFAKAPASRGVMRLESGFPRPDPGLHRLHRASTDIFITVFMYVASICYY